MRSVVPQPGSRVVLPEDLEYLKDWRETYFHREYEEYCGVQGWCLGSDQGSCRARPGWGLGQARERVPSTFVLRRRCDLSALPVWPVRMVMQAQGPRYRLILV